MEVSQEAEKLVKEFGAQLISELDDFPEFFTFEKSIIYSHRDFKEFYEGLKAGKKCAIVSGFNASGTIHIGHLPVFKTNLYFQKELGIPVFIPISDDESYVTGKIDNQEQGLKNALALAKQMLALGFDPNNTYFIIDQIFTDIYNLAIRFSRGTTYSQIKATYGYEGSTNPGIIFYPAVQTAHILLPETEDFGKIENVLVPIGLDEDSHIRICRDIAPKFGMKKPAILHSLFMPGLDGNKMKKSNPDTAIFLNDSPEEVKRKVGKAFTGGKESLAEQKEKGGDPAICVVAQYLKKYFLTDKEIGELTKGCTEGKNFCGNCKKLLTEKFQKEVAEFQENLKKVKDSDVDKCILRNRGCFTKFKGM